MTGIIGLVPRLVAQLGLPLLLEALLPSVRSLPQARGAEAGEALARLGEDLSARPLDRQASAEVHRHLEQGLALRLAHEGAALEEVNRSLRTEAVSGDAYVRRWRPTFGYAVAIAWSIQMLALSWTIAVSPAAATDLLSNLGGLGFLWGVALSVLGVNVVKRSQDKAVAFGAAPPTRSSSLFDAFAGFLRGRTQAPAAPEPSKKPNKE